MNVNFGIIKELEGERIRDKKARYEKIAERALSDLEKFFICLIFFERIAHDTIKILEIVIK